MHNIITKSAAETLFNKIEASKTPIAVFVRHGSWNATKVTTDLYRQAITKREKDLMGIYTPMVHPAWLEDDLAYMGVV